MLDKLIFNPGIRRDGTNYSNEGSWFDCDKVRFRNNRPENIGGWTKSISTALVGTPRSLLQYTTLESVDLMLVCTSRKVYLEESGITYDITPVRATTTLGTNPLTTGDVGSGLITISDVAHLAAVGDYVTISGATTVDGITDTEINLEFEVVEVPTADTYVIDTGGAATAGATAGGGSSVVVAYQINIGLDTSVLGVGWGAGPWSRLGWGSAAGSLAGQNLRLWSSDTFGEDVVFNIMDGAIFYRDSSLGLPIRAGYLEDLTGGVEVPTVARKVIVSDTDRHVIALATNEIGSADQDPMLIRWSDQESLLDWKPKSTNTAGDSRLSQGTRIVTGVRTNREILVFTDTSLYTLQYVGPPYIFSTEFISGNVNIVGPNALVAVHDDVYWMGETGFYKYDGRVRRIPCPIETFVFENINQYQAPKFHAGTLLGESEVWFFYCSADSDEIDRYVIYDFADDIWAYGSMARTAWIDRSTGARLYPQAASSDGFIYNHEIGQNDGSVTPEAAITSYVESADLRIGAGDKFMLVRRIIPDLDFSGSTAELPSVDFQISVRNYRGEAYRETPSGSVTRTSSSPVDIFNDNVMLRARGRSLALKVSCSTKDTSWRIGVPRIEMKQDGRR